MYSPYPLPVSFRRLMAKEPLPRLSEAESIRRHIYLILMTQLGEYRYDPEFGCRIWEHDFEVVNRLDAWKDQMERSIANTIKAREEGRINPQDMRVKIDIVEAPLKLGREQEIKRVRKKLTVTVSSIRLLATNELIEDFEYGLFFSPIALD